jgi:hypothetical protein
MNALFYIKAIAEAAPFIPLEMLPVRGHRRIV